MTTTLTTSGAVQTVLNFVNSSQTIYIGFGNKATPWSDENNAPLADAKTTQLYDLLGIKKASKVIPAYPLDMNDQSEPDYTVNGVKLKTCSADVAQTKGATYLVVETTLNTNELDGDRYRTVGLLLSPKLAPGVTSDAVNPQYIQSQGTLIALRNRTVVNRKEGAVKEFFIIGNT